MAAPADFPALDEHGRVSAEELNAWVLSKAKEYHGRGDGFDKILNAGRVDGYWTVAAHLQSRLREAQSESTAR